jgi:hypothetical protein
MSMQNDNIILENRQGVSESKKGRYKYVRIKWDHSVGRFIIL